MTSSQLPTFGGKTFATKTAAYRYFKAVLDRYALRERVGNEDAADLRDLLQNHPDLVAKLAGRTVSHFEVHPFIGGTRCFYLVRDDGTWIDFSIRRCLKEAFAAR